MCLDFSEYEDDNEAGIETRDYFAGQAMVALLQTSRDDPTVIAVQAFLIADEMMFRRKETNTEDAEPFSDN